MNAARIALLVLPLTGCLFGGCPDTPDEPEQSCVDDGAPSSAALELLDEDGEALDDGTSFTLEYGPQGGQHFYVSLRVFGGDLEDAFILSTFEGEDGTTGQAQYFQQEGCAGWEAIEGELLQVNSPSDTTGTLRVQLGHCDGECQTDVDSGDLLNFVADAEDEAVIAIVP